MGDDEVNRLPMRNLHQEQGADELVSSPEMEPYLQFAMALMQGLEPTAELEKLRQLPLRERYVWGSPRPCNGASPILTI